MNWADWAIISIVTLSVLIGVIRGFVREAISMLTWGAAFIAAMLLHGTLAIRLASLIATPSLRYAASWVMVFVAVLLLGALINFVVGQLVKATGLSGTDRLLGMLFGATRGLIVVMALLVMMPEVVPVHQDDWWRDSFLIARFLNFEDWARDTAASIFGAVKQLL